MYWTVIESKDGEEDNVKKICGGWRGLVAFIWLFSSVRFPIFSPLCVFRIVMRTMAEVEKI